MYTFKYDVLRNKIVINYFVLTIVAIVLPHFHKKVYVFPNPIFRV